MQPQQPTLAGPHLFTLLLSNLARAERQPRRNGFETDGSASTKAEPLTQGADAAAQSTLGRTYRRRADQGRAKCMTSVTGCRQPTNLRRVSQ